MKNIIFSLLIVLSILFLYQDVFADCGGTVRTWDAGAGNKRWDNNSNWSPNNQPDSPSEDALVVSASRPTQIRGNPSIGCIEVQSGQLLSRNGETLTINGDYFRNLTLNGFSVNTNHGNFWVDMAGTGHQTFENVDPINNLRISSNASVTFTEPFEIRDQLQFTGSNTTVYIDGNLTINSSASDITIPSGVTLEISSGNTFTVNVNLTVHGSLVINDGASLVFGNNETLTIGSTGTLTLAGVYGNIASISANSSGNSFHLNLNGLLNANYFRIDRLSAPGINASNTATIQNLQNGEFHYLANSGAAITLASGTLIPSTMSNLGFFDDDNHGNITNINATLYNSTATTLNNWSGSAGGTSNELDPNSKINWGSQAGTSLTLSDNTAPGNPPATINQNSSDTLFNTFAFALNQSSSATNITNVTISMIGTASANDINLVKIFKDSGGGTNCVYDSGTDTQIGIDLTLSGSPPQATISIPSGDVQTSSDTEIACIHLLASTASNAQDAKTIKFEITSTTDVTNSQGYNFSGSSGPPVSGGSSEINGDAVKVWQGDNSNSWSTNGNWRPSGEPTSNRDGKIGVGTRTTTINVAQAQCQNCTLQTGGTLSFDNTNRDFAIYGVLDVDTGFNFTNATNGGFISFRGTSNQTINLGTAFPGDLLIANTGSTPTNVVYLAGSSEVQGDVNISSGVLRVPDGYTLTVLGNLTVQSGGTLEIEPGGTLKLANNSILTVNNGGVLQIIGNASKNAIITSNSGSAAYSVIINGEIQAQYYNFDHLGINGVSIENSASINTTYHLQNGSFTYPVNSSSTFLKLKKQIPGNILSSMSFESSGSSATNITNIDTSGASAGTLNITSYSGDLAGLNYDNDPLYTISWNGATNTIDISSDAFGPSSVDAGSTYNMGRFSFTQSLADVSFNDTDYTSIKLTLLGSGSAGDISTVRLFYDSNCDSANGTLIGSGSFTGFPATVTFSLSASDFTVEADASTPPTRCIYVEYDISNGASDGKTVGVKIENSTDLSNDEGYDPSGST
ncbi:MAG: hypothetical protein KDD58_11650, partial [Bdellovibrionales bacterium]|nr:hypothetical protein [Bdellovibrionales bacterium]